MNVRVVGHQIGDALHAGEQRGICGSERVDNADGLVGQLEQAVVRNDDDRVDFLAQVLDAQFGRGFTTRPFEAERLGDHGDGQCALLLCGARDNRAGAGTGAAALATGHEDHIRAFQGLFDIRLMVLCGLRTLLRVRTSAKPTAGGIVERDLDVGVRAHQIFRISVDGHEFNVLQTFDDHAVDSIATGSADPHDLDVGLVVEIVCLGNLAHHCLLSLTVMLNCSAKPVTHTLFLGMYRDFFTCRGAAKGSVNSLRPSDHRRTAFLVVRV